MTWIDLEQALEAAIKSVIVNPSAGGPLLAAAATVFTGMIGFFGVVATLLWNGWLARRADRRKFELEQEAESRELAHKRDTLRVALKAEMQHLRKIFAEEKAHIEQVRCTWVPLIDSFNVYQENLNDIRLLTADEVERTEAYYTYQERAGYIARLGGATDMSKPIMGTNVWFDFRNISESEEWVRNNLFSDMDSIITAAEAAIASIKKASGQVQG
jgi:hypothetical protein